MRDTTLDNENASQHVTSVVVTALCNHAARSFRFGPRWRPVTLLV